jgi:hypothetical protein
MADDFVNKLTLNCLISKNQLYKLNKRLKENSDNKKLEEMREYSDRIEELFKSLLVNNSPDNLLLDVKNTFDAFVEKSIYYFKAQDNAVMFKNMRNDIQDDIDFEKEERDIECGNYTEEKDNKDDEENIVSDWY